MVSFAQLDRIGVVGAKLYYPTETIQHAGIVLGLGGAAGHIQVGFPVEILATLADSSRMSITLPSRQHAAW